MWLPAEPVFDPAYVRLLPGNTRRASAAQVALENLSIKTGNLGKVLNQNSSLDGLPAAEVEKAADLRTVAQLKDHRDHILYVNKITRLPAIHVVGPVGFEEPDTAFRLKL